MKMWCSVTYLEEFYLWFVPFGNSLEHLNVFLWEQNMVITYKNSLSPNFAKISKYILNIKYYSHIFN